MKTNTPLFFKRILLLLVVIFSISSVLQAQEKEKTITKLIHQNIVIDSCDGLETIANAKDIFSFNIDDNFKNWNTDKSGISTKEAEVQVFETIQNATFAQMFGSIDNDLEKLCLTQAQIINFCKKHSDWLFKDRCTLFLFKVEGEFFVASVFVLSDGLHVCVYRFGNAHVWLGERAHRVVAP